MIEITIDRDVGALVTKIAESITPVLARSVLKAANHAGGAIAETVTGTIGDTGALARSFLPARMILNTPTEVSAGALSSLVYARIQDQGGTIRPKTGKALAIPLTPEAEKRWPRDWPDKALAPIKSKRGNLLLAEVVKGKIKAVQYALKPQVTLQPKGYLAAAVDKSKAVVVAILTTDVADAIKGAVK